jgi:hypothetical protein
MMVVVVAAAAGNSAASVESRHRQSDLVDLPLRAKMPGGLLLLLQLLLCPSTVVVLEAILVAAADLVMADLAHRGLQQLDYVAYPGFESVFSSTNLWVLVGSRLRRLLLYLVELEWCEPISAIQFGRQ